jgi:uncharacterized protein (DUF302 family)
MHMKKKYGFGKTVPMDFKYAIDVVTAALKTEGFGVLTDIDMQATLKNKLGEDMPPYRILGACNPTLAQRALAAESPIGLLLPCNVVVRQEDNGTVHVEFMDPNVVFKEVDNLTVQALVKEVREQLDRVVTALSTLSQSPAMRLKKFFID